MQAILARRVGSANFTKWLTKPSFSHKHGIPSPLRTIPAPTHSQIRLLGSSLSWRSQHGAVAGKFWGFTTESVLARQFLINLANPGLRGKGKSLVDQGALLLRVQFPKHRFDIDRLLRTPRSRWKTWFRRLSDSDIVLGLILANVAVFMLWRVADRKFMVDNFMISLDNFKSGRLHTLITSAFSHIDLEHIVSNMIGLYFFGTSIARVFGPEFLLKLYLAGAIGGSIFYLIHHALMSSSSKGRGMFFSDPSRTPGLGASGAVNAIMLLEILLNPKATLYFDFIIPVPAILLGIFLIGKDVLRIIEGDSNISGSAHLGGAAVAAIAWARIRKGRFRF